MKNNNWNLAWGILGIAVIVMSFIDKDISKSIFHFEVDIWIYRGFWALISGGSIVSFLKRRREA